MNNEYTGDTKDFVKLSRLANGYLATEAKKSDAIYQFMDHYKIGKNEYGALMDAAAKGKHVMTHRLYGHHIIFDFPKDLKDQIHFLEHEFSDLFTKQGLPILPGEILEKAGYLKLFDKLSRNWNFVNGFDILSGTLSIYSGSVSLRDAINGNLVGEDFATLAKTLSIGVLEAAIACSTCNPFLLIGAIIQISSGFVSIKNDSLKNMVAKINDEYRIEFVIRNASIEDYVKDSQIRVKTIQDHVAEYTIDHCKTNPLKHRSKNMQTQDTKKMVIAAIRNFNRTQGSMPAMRALKKSMKLTKKSLEEGLIDSREDYMYAVANIIMGFGYDISGVYSKVEKAWNEEYLKLGTDFLFELIEFYNNVSNEDSKSNTVYVDPVSGLCMQRPDLSGVVQSVDSLMTDLIMSALYPSYFVGRTIVDRSMYAIRIRKFWKGFQKRVFEIVEEMLSEQIKPTQDE